MFRALLLALCCDVASAAISAKSYIVTDLAGRVIIERLADEVRPIASITKLVTVSQAKEQSASELITITAEDIRAGKMRSSPLKIGQAYSRASLIELALVSSDNVAAIALGRTTKKVVPLNMQIVEASGLHRDNRATARALAAYALQFYNTDLAAVSIRPFAASIAKRRNTNPLLIDEQWEFYLSKTGFTNASGGCLVVITKINNQPMVVVILGATSVKQRWLDLHHLRRELGDTIKIPQK